MHEADYIVYCKTGKQLLAHREKILLAEPKEVKKFGISQRTLYNIKRALLDGKGAKIKGRTLRLLQEYLAETTAK